MAVNKTFGITLDTKVSLTNRQFTVVEGDTGNKIDIEVMDDNVPVNLDGCLVLAVFAKSTGTSSQGTLEEDGGGITVDGNHVLIDLYTSSFSVGNVECELQIYSGVDKDILITTAKFNFQCRRGIFNEETVESTNEHPVLVQLITSVLGMEQAEIIRVENESGRVAAEEDREALHTKLKNLEVTATTLTPGTPATATIIEDEESIELQLGIPAGVNVMTHAEQHKTGGSDPISPSSIGAAPEAIELTGTLLAGGWANGVQTVTVNGITSTSKGTIGLRAPTLAQREAARIAQMSLTAQGTNSVTITADGAVPGINIPFIILIVG